MIAIITGGTKGMGRATVMYLAANNYNIALCARKEPEVQKFISELRKQFPSQSFFGMSADLENTRDVNAFADFALQNLNTVDVLVNNAGLFIPGSFLNEKEDTIERHMKVNLFAPYRFAEAIVPGMVSRGEGHIFNICSVASIKPVKTAASYSISKAALLSLTKILREELQDTGVSVTAILPGSTFTSSWAGSDIPPGRLVAAEDIARAIGSCLAMSAGANVDEIIVRPQKGEL